MAEMEKVEDGLANHRATNAEDSATLSEDSSIEEDARVIAEDVAESMKKQLAVEEAQMLLFVEQHTPKKESQETNEVSPALPPFAPIRKEENLSRSVNTEEDRSGMELEGSKLHQSDAAKESADGLDYSADTSQLDGSNFSSRGGGLERTSPPPDNQEIVQPRGEPSLRPRHSPDGGKRPASQEKLLEEGLLHNNPIKPVNSKRTPKMIRRCGKSALLCLGAGFAFLWRCLAASFVWCWLCISLVASNMASSVTEAAHAVTQCFRDCLDYHSFMLSLAPSAVNYAASVATKAEKGLVFCFVSLIVSMWTEIYPSVPSVNCFAAILMLLFQQPGQWKQSKYHSILLIVIVLASICIDIDWLSYKYLPGALDGEDMAYRIQQDSSPVWAFAWYGVLLNIGLKLLCLNESLKASEPGRMIRRKIAERGGKCLVSTRIPDDLSVAVKDKCIAIAWIEILCSLLCFGCFFAVEFDVVSARSILSDVPLQMLSLQGALLLKATSGFLVFLSFLHHIRVKDLLGLFACRSVCPALREARGGRDRILSKMAKFLKCIVVTKLLDFALGVIVWVGLSSAHSQTGFDAPHEVTTLLGMILGIQVCTTILSPILVAVVVWYVRLSKQSRMPSRQRAMEENTPMSSRKANRKKRGSNFTSRNPTRLRLDNAFSSPHGRDYDLSEPGTSQKTFESRLSGASARPATPSAELDLNATCEPRQFQAEWRSLPEGLTLSHRCQELPTLSDCHKHFSSARFFVVGSGIVSGESRLFILAQRTGSHWMPSRCLAEITFNSGNFRMKAEIRCRNSDEVRFFLSAMNLRELFGELS